MISKILKAYTEVPLMLRIFIGLVVGSVLGFILPGAEAIGLLGKVFVGSLKAMAPILVLVLIVASLAKAREGLGKRFVNVIVLYILSTLIAATIAVVFSFAFPVHLILPNAGSTESAPAALSTVFSKILNDLISNPLVAVSNATYLSILFWAIIIGMALKKKASAQTIGIIHEFAETITLVVQWIIQCAPFGVLGLVYTSVSESGVDVLITYGKLLAVLISCMLTTSLIVNPLISSFLLRKNPYPLLWECLKMSAVNAFFTRSSAANIPINMALCKKLGLTEDFYSVSIPLGCTINMDGAACTITVMTLACCATLGINVDFGSALLLSALATLGACGASGVPGGSLLLIPMACSMFGISQDISMQVVAIGFIIGVVQDSVETALNSSGDVFFTATADLYARKKEVQKL